MLRDGDDQDTFFAKFAAAWGPTPEQRLLAWMLDEAEAFRAMTGRPSLWEQEQMAKHPEVTAMSADNRPAPRVEVRRGTPALGVERAGPSPEKDFLDNRGSQARAPYRDKQGAARGRNPLREKD